FIVICVCTRYVSLSSIVASGVIILMVFVLYGKSIATLGGASVIIMCTVMGAMVIIRHKSNIVRLIKGNERKLGEKKE
ncbi:MAG: glycerol-3-phosphate acyltransferase, partial [Clostridia bacterium]|nr:glycerol-3-phosphate acyltransferase [Clostridia bacterium]